jgi:hypothetical protein
MRVPGVVEAVDSEIIGAPLSPGRVKHRLGLRQTGSPFTSIPTAKKVLETLFDLLEGIGIFVAIRDAQVLRKPSGAALLCQVSPWGEACIQTLKLDSC